MMQVLKNGALARILHNDIWKRCVTFAQQYSPELPAEPIIEYWLRTFFDTKSSAVHILINLNDQHMLTAHCIIVIAQEGDFTVIYAQQMQDDAKSSTFMDECFEYIDKLASQINAHCCVMTPYKGVKALEKRYGYKSVRTIMVKHCTK